jgi:hypothetical protein
LLVAVKGKEVPFECTCHGCPNFVGGIIRMFIL